MFLKRPFWASHRACSIPAAIPEFAVPSPDPAPSETVARLICWLLYRNVCVECSICSTAAPQCGGPLNARHSCKIHRAGIENVSEIMHGYKPYAVEHAKPLHQRVHPTKKKELTTFFVEVFVAIGFPCWTRKLRPCLEYENLLGTLLFTVGVSRTCQHRQVYRHVLCCCDMLLKNVWSLLPS